MSKCPYCGAAVNRTMFNRFGKTEGYQALCRECGAIGPTNVVADDMAQKATIAMFTQPAHLLNEAGYIRLADDEVVVKRATAETAFSWAMGFVGSGGMTKDDYAAKDGLTAALEGKE